MHYLASTELVERLKREGYDAWTISLWEEWVKRGCEFQSIVAEIRDAFSNVELGDGIGMIEADGYDNCATEDELKRLRAMDERKRWQNISSNDLNNYYCSFGFCDGKGGLFLLPAYLLCDLRDEYNFDFVLLKLVNRLADSRNDVPHWLQLIDRRQGIALCRLLEQLKLHPEYHSESEQFTLAIQAIESSMPATNAG